MKGPIFIIASSLMIGISRSSVSLSSPLIPGSRIFPDGERFSPEPPRLLSAESYISQSHDASPGPTMPTITILASDLPTEIHLLERQECNLLIIQNRQNHKSFDFEQNAAAGTVASYFSAVDRAFAHCLEFLKLTNDPNEWDKDWYLMPFIRSLNNAVKHMPQCHEIVNFFVSKRAITKTAAKKDPWGFIRHVGFGVYVAQPVHTSIPKRIRWQVRQAVFEIWGGLLKILFSEKINELIALINHPMFAFLEGRLPPEIKTTLRRMDNFGQSPIPRDRDPRPDMESLIRDWSYLTEFKGDLDALRMVYDWKQANNEGHVVVNLSHRCDQEDTTTFDLMRTALMSMGWDENDITIVSAEDAE